MSNRCWIGRLDDQLPDQAGDDKQCHETATYPTGDYNNDTPLWSQMMDDCARRWLNGIQNEADLDDGVEAGQAWHTLQVSINKNQMKIHNE